MSSITDATSSTTTPNTPEPTKLCSVSMTVSIILIVGALIAGCYAYYKFHNFQKKILSEKQDLNKRMNTIARDLLENPKKIDIVENNTTLLKNLAN